MRAILGCTRPTSAVGMRFVLDLPSMEQRHKIAQVKALLRVTADTEHPLHPTLSVTRTSRLKRGAAWIAQAQETVSQCCSIDAIRRGRDWIPALDEGQFTSVVATLGRECREWPANAADAEVKAIIEEVSRPGDVIVYTDGSVQRGLKSGWAFSATASGRTMGEGSGAFKQTTSSMSMEIHAISQALLWLQNQPFAHAVMATDSMSTLEKVRCGQLYADWVEPLRNSHLKKLTWLFCPGHSGVRGNERADRLAGSAQPGEDRLILDPPAVIKSVKLHLQQQESTPNSYTLDMLQEKGVQRGAGCQKDLSGLARRVHNQMLFNTISLPTLRWTMERRAEQIWVCPDCSDAASSTE